MFDRLAESDYYVMFLFLQSSGIYEPSVYHALVVIFLEFFSWGLLTAPIIKVRHVYDSNIIFDTVCMLKYVNIKSPTLQLYAIISFAFPHL